MGRLISGAAARLLPGAVALLVLAALRLPPVAAEALVPVRVVPMLGAVVALWVIASLVPVARRHPRLRPALLAVAASGLALAPCVAALRGLGLEARISDPRGTVATLPPGAVDLSGPDLREVPFVRRWSIRWTGTLEVPRSGPYRLWAEGRGDVRVEVDGHPLLAGSGDPLDVGVDVALAEGSHALDVRLDRVGPGPRLRLGWRRPTALGPRDEVIPALFYGKRPPRVVEIARDVAAHVLALAAAWLFLALVPVRPRTVVVRPLPSRAVEIARSLAGHAAVVAAMSWPLVTDLAGLGFTNSPDGRLNTWILAWDVKALASAPARLFDAPIFHPLPDALAFSENLLGPAILTAPANVLGHPVLAYNLALLGSLVVSGLGTELLARRLGAGRVAAFVAGACFAVGAHRWIRLAHLHAQVTLFLPFALLALERFHERRSLRRAAAVGLLVALQGLSSVYLGAITATAVLAAALVGVLGPWRARDAARLALGLGAGALLLLPVALPYLRMRAFQGMEWTLQDIATYATTLTSYAAGGTRAWGALTQRHLDPVSVQDTLFPGITLLFLGLAGLSRAPRRFRFAAIVAGVLGILVSLGPETAFYRFLHEHVVLVRGVRALSRFSLIPVLALCIGLGLALARRPWLSLLALLAVCLESTNAPLGVVAAPAPSSTALALKRGSGVVAYVPPGEGDTAAMLEQLVHGRTLLNGDSGFVPRPYSRVMELLQPPLGDDAWRLLRAVGVTDVVVDGHVERVPAGDVARAPVPGRVAPALFAADGLHVVLPESATVHALSFEVDDGPWVAAPLLWTSDDGVTWTPRAATASLADATMSLYADPGRGVGQVRFEPVTTRYLRLGADVPARPGPAWVR